MGVQLREDMKGLTMDELDRQTDELDGQALQMNANLVADQTLESTRRILTMCVETESTGTKTLELIERQGEQLNCIDQHMDSMNEDMKDTEKTLTRMERWCGLCVCPCRGKQWFSENPDTWCSPGRSGLVSAQPQTLDAANLEGQPYIVRLTGDAREEEMDDNMGQVSFLIGNLRNMAVDMGQQIDGQNQFIDSIARKADSNTNRLQVINDRTAKLLV